MTDSDLQTMAVGLTPRLLCERDTAKYLGMSRAFLRKSGIDDRHLVVADGSGLSDLNKVTARLLTDLFAVMFSRPDGKAFIDSLARGGVNGSLEKRFVGCEGYVFAKTGYISGVRALSGYVRTYDEEWLTFSIIYNSIPGNSEIKKFPTAADGKKRVAETLESAEFEPTPAGKKTAKAPPKKAPAKGDVKKSSGRTRKSFGSVVTYNPDPKAKLRANSQRAEALEILKAQRGNKMKTDEFLAELEKLTGARGKAIGLLQKLAGPRSQYVILSD